MVNQLLKFPSVRLRRLRQKDWVRDLVAETNLQTQDLIMPLFFHDQDDKNHPIQTLPNQYCYSVNNLIDSVQKYVDVGIKAFAVFPRIQSDYKCFKGSHSFAKDNLPCKVISDLKSRFPHIGFIGDIALDAYTSHGHDGVLYGNDIANDETVEILAEQALNFAKAGFDCLAPSDMMDGRIGQIRKKLDENGFQDVILISYALKYASSFYGPFRDATGTSDCLKGANKKTYQMDGRNIKEAFQEVSMDIQEGADGIIIKPALAYLDMISRIKQEFNIPIFAYQVSGEYAMFKFAADHKVFNWEQAMLESLVSIKRAGANSILTYAAGEIAEILN